MIDSILSEGGLKIEQIDAIAFSRGPGSFTGVRISTAVAQGLAISSDLPLIPISSLLALAQGIYREKGAQKALVGLDARMEEVYWAACKLNEKNIMEFFTKETICSPANAPIPEISHWHCAGSAWQEYSDVLLKNFKKSTLEIHANFFIHAQDVAYLAKTELQKGNILDPSQALPIYLRDEVVKKKTYE